MKKILILLYLIVYTKILFAQERRGYGLLLPTEEQLKQIPYIPSFSLPPNFALPKQKNLSDQMPPVGNQGYQGSCTAWAIAYALKSYQEKRQNNWMFLEGGIVRSDRICSPSFVFNTAKNIIRNSNCLDGIPFALAFDVLNNIGTSFLNQFGYDETNCTNLPTPEIRNGASINKISFAQGLNPQNLEEIKYNISVENPVVIGIALDDFFQPDGFEYFTTKKFYTYIPKGALSNYHAMLCIGYDNDKKTFQVLNSWGDHWANDGYVDIPYEWFPLLVKEAYLVNDAYSYGHFVNPNNKEAETEQTIVNFDSYSSWFKEGYYREYKNLRIGLTNLNIQDSSGTVIFTDIDSNKILNTFQYKMNIPTSFYIKDRKITFTLTGIGKAGKNPFKKAAFFNIRIDNTIDKEFIDKLNIINNFKLQKDLIQNIKVQQQIQQK